MSNRRRAQHRDAHGPARSQSEVIIAIITGVAVVVVTAVVIWGIWLATKPDTVATPTLPSTSSTSVSPSSSTTAGGSTTSTGAATSSTTAAPTSTTAPPASSTSSTTKP